MGVGFMSNFNKYKGLLANMLTFAKAVGIKNVDAQMTSLKMDDKNAWISDDKCAKGAAPAKKDDKKPAAPAKKDDKKPAAPAKKDRILQAPVKKDDKKPAAPAKKDDKKDDKKPAAPAKKDDKKPAAPAKKPAASSSNWDLNKKTGKANVSGNDSWDAYIDMEQVKDFDKTKLALNKDCMTAAWKSFFNPIMFSKLDAKLQDLYDFKALFGVLKFLNENLSNANAQGVYKAMMGMSWFAKLKMKVKKTTGKIKVSLNKTGKNISAHLKKTGKAIAAGAKKIGAAVKGGLKVNVKAPKVKVGVKAAAKPKVSLKVKAKPKVAVKAKVAAKPKVKVGVKAKVGAKKRRLQAAAKKDDTSSGFLPALPTDNKKPADDKKPATPAKTDGETDIDMTADGLPVSKYTGDVEVPKDLTGDSDQTAPNTANLVKLCFMLFAALLTMY